MNPYETQTPYVSSYVIVRKEDQVAFLMRSNTAWMNGHYGLPSGKVESDESATAAACREAAEEIGITVKPEDLVFAHLMHRHEETNWIDIFFELRSYEGDAVNAEPDKHSELAWFDLQMLPEKVLEYIKIAVGHIENGVQFSEYKWGV
jgi:8-oxo-dGTP diphosphatase